MPPPVHAQDHAQIRRAGCCQAADTIQLSGHGGR
eukprot:CAMPEP_0182888762 /NCGR_PEP_ID=MMETSP0034_2-20130328/21641_1 /TAXON_ID=156128 /ORGANISM="Nephroselmis pyriformis, Strain CCMP717" /LENGTH=33 /DNA_ID= /DNA_START= /DNA_END= /DNA_ORIENTATION=